MLARERQAEWLCKLLSDEYHKEQDKFKEVWILGYSFKPESNITTGSPAILCKNILEEWDIPVMLHDPFVDKHPMAWSDSARGELILIGTKHEVFKQWRFPQGSIVIDVFRYIEDQEGVKIIRVGE